MRLVMLGLVALATLGGCRSEVRSDAIPAASDLDTLEQRLAQHPCVGDLNQWERNYRFSRRPAMFFAHLVHPDVDVIELHLRKAGKVDIPTGRNALSARPDGDWPDSRSIQSLDGRFTLSSKALTLVGCKPSGKNRRQ